MSPTPAEELRLYAAGCRQIAGVDEAGRGCWAGPVVAAAVVLPVTVYHTPALLAGVDDSKLLAASERERLYHQITALAVGYAVGVVPAFIIDSHGILPATRLAMEIALLKLHCLPDALLIDAVQLAGWRGPQLNLIKGDGRSISIAAASIVAKVYRDWLMAGLARLTPDYGFARHKGYGTAAHYQALQTHGPSPQHRFSFRPLAADQLRVKS